ISIRGDTEAAKESVLQFVSQFNDLSALITELSKFEPENEFTGPLLGNRDITQIRNRLSELLIDPVKGLPKTDNMLFSLGIQLNNKGLLVADDAVLDGKIKDNFGLVADLFRDKGESDNPNIAFVGMSEKTAISTDGYPVNITKVATQGHYQSPELPQVVIVDDTNNKFSITVDGRPSEQIELAPRSYRLNEFARTLQNAIVSDNLIGDRGVRVLAENNRIRVLSGRFGSSSSISFAPGLNQNALPPALGEGESVAGENIEGTINGNRAEGNGQLLKAPDDSGPAAGMRLFAKLSESQLNPQAAEASVSVTKGIGSRLSSYLETVVNPLTGSMNRITKNLRDRIGDLDGQMKRMEERIESKRQRLREKFTRMETKLSSLRSQQAFMKGQLGGGGSALPGLPG
ncbi:MAG: flagellar filament capping protein FliD, partial [bacterium]